MQDHSNSVQELGCLEEFKGITINDRKHVRVTGRTDTDTTIVKSDPRYRELHHGRTASEKDDIFTTGLNASGTAVSESCEGYTKSTFHIYHKRERRHLVISPITDPRREQYCPPSRKKWAKKHPHPIADDPWEDEHREGYYMHLPNLAFRDPPRTLRRGGTKHGTPICLVYNSWLWRRWKLQFGSGLAEDGVIDPRGVVSYGYHDSRDDDYALKGYPVRSWRMWCESGKQYHREVNKKRKVEKLASSDLSISVTTEVPSPTHSEKPVNKQLIDEVVHLDWTSPLSRNTRLYQFRYAGLEFCWKGTSTVKETRKFGSFLRYHHLKLVVKVSMNNPTEETRVSHAKYCLAKYTASVAAEKAGMLEVYDTAIKCLLLEHVEAHGGSELENVKETRVYDLVIATAMCMIVAEWQKRKTIKTLVEIALAGEGAIAA
ncbi:hypothetical protein LTS18_014362 [Coniosporium uncinatum]|uniref:Uncharacterized protein n=1 Tax=Coniosporium uncinatum TaxID=93489 RepID=A0ACC3D961_9PEZI|nr:hypothetical protein LTS18_014362 [Coniosporium uncinatum]